MHNCLPHHQKLNEIEATLGYPLGESMAFSLVDSLLCDEQSIFPQKFVEALNSLHINRYFVPQELLGSLTRFDEFCAIFRAVFRRDPTVGLGYGFTSFMAAIIVWLFGSAEQKKELAQSILAGQTVSVAFHEKNHGNDVLSNQLTALCVEDNLLLQGEKWVVNNIRESQYYVLFVKTNAQAGPRGFSTILFDKSTCPEQALHYLPKVKTLGVRGCRIAGAQFNACKVTQEAIIGKSGNGFEQVLKSFQVTKTLIAGMVMGTVDTYFRLSAQSMLQIHPLNEWDKFQQQSCIDAFADCLICDIFSMTMCRALHVLTEQMSVYSAVSKYFILTHLEKSIVNLKYHTGLLGCLREGNYALLQKLERDFSVGNLGHASGSVCLSHIASQLPRILHTAPHTIIDTHDLETLFDVSAAIPTFNGDRLKLTNSGKDSILSGFKQIEETSTQLADLIEIINLEFSDLQTAVKNKAAEDKVINFDLSKRYTLLVTLVSVYFFGHYNKSRVNKNIIIYCLAKLIKQYIQPTLEINDKYRMAIYDSFYDCYDKQMTFEIFPKSLQPQPPKKEIQ